MPADSGVVAVRAFFAVIPPRPVREALEAVRDPLKEVAPLGRWVHPSLWHLTLKFLGEVEDDLVPAIGDLAGRLVAGHESFEMSFKDTGVFPHPERPKVLWIGLGDGVEPMIRLAADVDQGLDGLGFEPDNKPYQPHLTIARFREPHQSATVVEHVGPTDEIARFEVEEVVLMESVLRPRGPDYSVIERLPLTPREKPEEEGDGDSDGDGDSEGDHGTAPEPTADQEPFADEGDHDEGTDE